LAIARSSSAAAGRPTSPNRASTTRWCADDSVTGSLATAREVYPPVEARAVGDVLTRLAPRSSSFAVGRPHPLERLLAADHVVANDGDLAEFLARSAAKRS